MIRRNIVLILLLAVLLVSCKSLDVCKHDYHYELSPGGLYYTQSCSLCGKASIVVDDDFVKRTAPLYGLEGISYIQHPRSAEDYENNILYNCLKGDYTKQIRCSSSSEAQNVYRLLFEEKFFVSKNNNHKVNRYDSLVHTYPDVMIYQINQFKKVSVNDSNIVINIECKDPNHYPNGIPTEKNLFYMQLMGLDAIKQKYDEFHANGTITEEMSDKEKLEFYSRYLQKTIRRSTKIMDEKIGITKTDSLYNAMNGFESNCVSAATVMNVFMHLEGIKSQNYSVDGHMITRILTSEKEDILFDYYSNQKIFYGGEAEYDRVRSSESDRAVRGGFAWGNSGRLLF